MTLAAIIIIVIAGALRTRLGRLYLARWLIQIGIVTGEAGSRILERVKQERLKREGGQ